MENNFSYMLIALLAFLIGIPVAMDLQLFPAGIIRAIGFLALFSIGVWSLKGAGNVFKAAIFFVLAGIILSVLSELQATKMFFVGSVITMLAYLVLATAHAFRQIVTDIQMSTNRIIGAICVYLLLGVIWSLLYMLLELANPGSFGGLLSHCDSGCWSPDWVYFSFVTLSTLGYGDLLPLTFSARALSYMEAIVGQFYLAVMVAGLVSAYITAKTDPQSDD